jgi:putative sterol carrier protein
MTVETVPRPPAEAEAFGAWVAAASDADLQATLAAHREVVLTEIFARMEQHFDPGAAKETAAIVEWQVLGRADGGTDRFQARIGDGRCVVTRDGTAVPGLTVTIKPVDFLRVIAGDVAGPRLFMMRKVKVKGDLMLAGRLATLFRLPEPARAR